MHLMEGIQNLQPIIDSLALVPFNKIPKVGKNMRTWNWYPRDNRDEQSHPLALDFLKRWPYNESVVLKRPLSRRVDVAVVAPLADRAWLNTPKMTKLVDIVKSTASREERPFLFKPSPRAMIVLKWLKAYK